MKDKPIGKTIQLRDGRALGYAEYGDPSGWPVIAFHGMPGSRWVMAVAEEAAQNAGMRIIAPERPGYGLSHPYNKPSLLAYTDDIAELAGALGLLEFIVMGVSGGGPYAIACAYKFANRLKAAAVVSGIGSLRTPGSLRGMVPTNRIMFSLGRLSPALTGFLLPRLIRSSLPQLEAHIKAGTSPLPDVGPEIFAILGLDQREAIRTGGQGIKYDMHNLWQPWGFRLEDIHLPVYLWHGEADDLALAGLARRLAEQLPACESIFCPGEGHTGPLTKHMDMILTRLAAAGQRRL